MAQRHVDEFTFEWKLGHGAMRGDLQRLRDCTRSRQPMDSATAALLAEWFGCFARMLHHHHETEDADVFPILAANDPSFSADHGALKRDHAQLDTALEAVRGSLGALRGELDDSVRQQRSRQLADETAALTTLVAEHLEREEQAVIPRLDPHYSVKDFRLMKRNNHKRYPMSDVKWSVPWILGAVPDEHRARLLTQIPGFIRLLNRLFWQKSYDRIAAPLRTGAVSA